jgi:hypothetical protein
VTCVTCHIPIHRSTRSHEFAVDAAVSLHVSTAAARHGEGDITSYRALSPADSPSFNTRKGRKDGAVRTSGLQGCRSGANCSRLQQLGRVAYIDSAAELNECQQ